MERKGYVGPPKADLIDAHMVTRVADDAHIPIFKVGRVNVRQCGSSVARCEWGFLILASFLYFLLRQCALYFVEKIHHYILLSLLFTTSTTTTTTTIYYYYYIPRLLSSSPCWSSSLQFWLSSLSILEFFTPCLAAQTKQCANLVEVSRDVLPTVVSRDVSPTEAS